MAPKIGSIALLAILASYSLLLCAQPSIGKPEVREIKTCWGNVTRDHIEILTQVLIYNPNPIPLPLKDVLTELEMNGLKVGEGKALKAEILPGNNTVVLSTRFENRKIPEWFATHVKNDETSYVKFKGYLVFDLKITEFRYPFEQSDSIKTDFLKGIDSTVQRKIDFPVKLTIESAKSYWGKVEKDFTEIITLIDVRNEDMVPVLFTKFKYSLDMNGVKMAEGISSLLVLIPPKSKESLILVTKIDNEMLDDWFVKHVENREKTEIKIELEAFVEVFGREMSFLLVKSKSFLETEIFRCTCYFETGILVCQY
ncbi:MAG: LEA type 2 family protein [Archaeoglobaceae archaeon]